METQAVWELVHLREAEYGVRNTSNESLRYVSVTSNLNVAHHRTDGTEIAPGHVFAFGIDRHADAEEVWVCITWLGVEGERGEQEMSLIESFSSVEASGSNILDIAS